MNSSMIFFSCLLFASCALAQLPSNFFGGFSGGLPGSFNGFSASQTQAQVPTPGNGRASTGTRPGGPVLFPVSPEGGETSGVVVGASGYGFIPPGVQNLVAGRGGPSASFTGSFSQPFPQSFFNFS